MDGRRRSKRSSPRRRAPPRDGGARIFPAARAAASRRRSLPPGVRRACDDGACARWASPSSRLAPRSRNARVALEYFAEHGEDLLSQQAMPSSAARSYVAFRPLGVLLAIMPWNFPFWQVIRAAAPALMAGERHAAQACGEYNSLRARDRARLRRGRSPAGRLFRQLLVRAERKSADRRRSSHRRRDAHRQRRAPASRSPARRVST